MPSMSDDDDYPFDAASTACRGMGIVADTFWRLPGVRRSNSPHAFAAAGPAAADITAEHPLDLPHGMDSPVGRVHAADGSILLLGVGHDANTTIHLAESLAPVRYRRSKYLTVWRDGQPGRFDYDEIDHCCENFNLMDRVARCRAAAAAWHRRPCRSPPDSIARYRGNGSRPASRTRDRVSHPPGVDHECDEARASLK